jgi:hypothetical protein
MLIEERGGLDGARVGSNCLYNAVWTALVAVLCFLLLAD